MEGRTWREGVAIPPAAPTDRFPRLKGPQIFDVAVTCTRRIISPGTCCTWDEGPDPDVMFALSSGDGGDTWQRSPAIGPAEPCPNGTEGGSEPSVAELPDGRLWMVFRTVFGELWQCVSPDGGLTWGPPRSTGLASALGNQPPRFAQARSSGSGDRCRRFMAGGREIKAVTLQDYEQRMLRVLVHIQQNLDGELSLDQLARVAHFSPFHFHRIFRGMVGETVREHVRRIRLERAAQRLKTSTAAVTEIAFEAGYDSHEAFTRAFRAMTGIAPSAFRSQQRNLDTDRVPSGVHYQPGRLLDDFQPCETGGAAMEVQIKKVEPIRVAFMRHTGPYDQCGPVWEKFCAYMGAQGWLGPGAQFLGLCHDDPEVTPPERIRYDACLVVDETFEPVGEIGVQTIAGGEYAVTTHHGPYDRFSETYARLYGQWIPRNGRSALSAPCLEFYLNDPDSTEPEELLTDLYAPLEPA